MNNSIDILQELSKYTYGNMTRYKYGKHLNVSEKYKKGRVGASTWINELIYYYINKEKNLIIEFQNDIKRQKQELQKLKEGDYKKALLDELEVLQSKLHEISAMGMPTKKLKNKF